MIKHDLPSKRSHITEMQAQFMAQAIWRLEQATSRNLPPTGKELTIAEYQRFASLPEHEAFMWAALVCGFVCADFIHACALEAIHARPEEQIQSFSFNELRKYIHVLQRTEKWNVQYSTALYQAVTSKALGLVAERLACDPSLRFPLIVEEAEVGLSEH
jgi:hypothetical protein